jgi:hypothetical protein
MDQTLAQLILGILVLATVIAWVRKRNANAPADIDFAWTPTTPAVAPAIAPPVATPSGIHTLLKWALAAWAIGYAVLSCSPMLITGADTGTSVAAGGIASLVVGATLFGPWIVGLLVLGVLVWVTK